MRRLHGCERHRKRRKSKWPNKGEKELGESETEQERRIRYEKFGKPESDDETWPLQRDALTEKIKGHFSWQEVLIETARDNWVKNMEREKRDKP